MASTIAQHLGEKAWEHPRTLSRPLLCAEAVEEVFPDRLAMCVGQVAYRSPATQEPGAGIQRVKTVETG